MQTKSGRRTQTATNSVFISPWSLSGFRKDRFIYFFEIRIYFLIENGQFWVASPLDVNHVETSGDRAQTSNRRSQAYVDAVRVCLQGKDQRQDFRS